MAKSQPDLVLQRLLEMNGAGVFDRDYYCGDDLFSAMTRHSPAALESAISFLKEPVRKRAEKILLLARFESDRAVELRKLWARPDGFELYLDIASSPTTGESGRIFDDLANLPPAWRSSIASNAWAFVNESSADHWWKADLERAGFSKMEAYLLRTKALAEVASKNPEIALQRMAGLGIQKIKEEGGFDTGDPSGDGRWAIIKNALSAHPEKTAGLVALLATEQDRGIAKEILEGIPVENELKAANNIETPEQWLEQVARIDPRLSYTYGTMPGTWPSSKRAALSELFRALPDDDRKQRAAKALAGSVVGNDLVTSLSGEAIRYLLIQPAEAPVMDPGVLEDPANPASRSIPWLRETSTYAGNLAVTEPETARDWVETLPEGQPKLWARLNVLTIWTQYDPKAADQWLKSLPAAVQAGIQEVRVKK